jgi:hypothetical protein
LADNKRIASTGGEEFVIVTSTGGCVKREVRQLLRIGGSKILSVDLDGATINPTTCDLRLANRVSPKRFEEKKQ